MKYIYESVIISDAIVLIEFIAAVMSEAFDAE